MFFHCSSLTWLDLRRFDTSNVTSMASMFAGCKSLVSLDLRGIETSKVTNMYGMFYGCESLTSLDLRSFNTSNVENMGYMFYGDGKLTTIYCNDTWTCASSEKMFWFCVNLKGAITISQSKNKDVADANPNTGFFTSKLETYNLSINGTPVTDVNQWNLASIDGVEGTAYFYDATKTLTLMNTQIAVSERNVNVIESRLDTLYIEVYGECSLSSKLSAGIAGLSHIVIKGDGLLLVSGYGAIYWLNQSKSLTVEGGVKVMVQGTNLCAIGPCQSIKVKGSETYLILRGAEGSCEKVNELQLSDGLAILSPSGAKFNGSTIVDKDGNAIINDWVAIGYQEIIDQVIIDSISIENFDWPQDFTAADYKVTTTTRGVKYITVGYEKYRNELPWHDGYNVTAGSDYGVYFLVELEEGYAFADNVKAYVKRNGTLQKHDFKEDYTDQPLKKRFIWATYTVPVPDGGAYIHSTSVVSEIDTPRGGVEPQRTIENTGEDTPKNSVDITNITWYKFDADGNITIVPNGTDFASGTKYCCKLTLAPKEGKQFHENTRFTYNGKQCDIKKYNKEEFYNYRDTSVVMFNGSQSASMFIFFTIIIDCCIISFNQKPCRTRTWMV